MKGKAFKIFRNVDPHAMFKIYVNITLMSARYVPNTLFSSRFAITVLCAMLLSSQT